MGEDKKSMTASLGGTSLLGLMSIIIYFLRRITQRVYSKAWKGPSFRNHKNKAEIQLLCDETCTAEVG